MKISRHLLWEAEEKCDSKKGNDEMYDKWLTMLWLRLRGKLGDYN